MNIEQIRRILVAGAGTMGQQIALQCAMYGYEVALYDAKPEALAPALDQIKTYAGHLVSQKQLTPSQQEATLARITSTSDPETAATEVDLLSESVPEDPALKGEVLSQFNTLCPARTIFTTNSSTLVPSMFAEATGRPAQFAALHFHTYVWESNVVDIMPHPGTAEETVTLLEAFARRIGQIPIVLQQEQHGYVFNTMLSALNGAALTLASKGVAAIEDVDRAWMGVMKTPIGPMGIMDIVGLETVWQITQYWAATLDDPQLRANAEFVRDYVDKGWLGVKTGRGFYSYPEPAYQQPGFLTGESD